MTTYAEMLMNQSEANSAFNASQAEINRDWNEYMSGTSHQREVADLIAAGLNPVLSANSGSTWNSVSNASADPSSAAGLANLAMTQMNNAASLEISRISAEATKAAAGATAAATMAAANTTAAANIRSAEISKESAPVSVSGSVFGSGGSVSMPAYMAEDIASSANSAWTNYWNTNNMSGNYSEGNYRRHG